MTYRVSTQCKVWRTRDSQKNGRCLVIQLSLTLCDPVDYSPPGSSVHGDYQARILPCPPPGGLPNPGSEPRSSALQADSLPAELPGKLPPPPGKTMVPVSIFIVNKLLSQIGGLQQVRIKMLLKINN